MPAEARPPEAQPEADAAPEVQPEAAVVPDDVSIESLLTLDTQKPLPSISAPPDDLPAVSQADKTDPPVGAGGGESMHGARVDYSPTRTILGALPENTEFTGDQLLRLFDINNEALGNRPFRESIQRDLAGTRFDEWIRLNVPAGRTMSRDQLLEAFDKVAPELRMISSLESRIWKTVRFSTNRMGRRVLSVETMGHLNLLVPATTVLSHTKKRSLQIS